MSVSPAAAQHEAGWQIKAREKREAVNSAIPPHWRIAHVPDADELRDAQHYARKFLTEREIGITETADARALLEKIAGGQYTALEVTEAFCHRAAIAHQTVSTYDYRL
jgi:amidase